MWVCISGQNKLRILMPRVSNGLVSEQISNRVKRREGAESYATRNCDETNYCIPRIRSKRGEQRPLYQGLILWNSIPRDIKKINDRSRFSSEIRALTPFCSNAVNSLL